MAFTFPEDYDVFATMGSTTDSDFAEATSGSVILNNDEWMDIAIPVVGKKVKEYLLDWIEAETGRPAEDSVLVCKALPSTDTVSGTYKAFVPGVTNPSSSGNFDLVVTDDGVNEIVGFQIKMKDYKAFYDNDLVFSWNAFD